MKRWALLLLAACGGSNVDDPAGDADFQADTFNETGNDAATDVARDVPIDVELGADTQVDALPPPGASRLLHWSDGDDLRVVAAEGAGTDGYLRGGPFESSLWAADDRWSWYLQHLAGDGAPTEEFARATLPMLPDRNNEVSSVLKMALLRDAPDTNAEQLAVSERQSPGAAGESDSAYPSHTRVEPVFYQRQWIKFSPDTRDRATAIGEGTFYQTFWEMRAEPDYRLRVALSYSDAIGLVVRAHDDSIRESAPLHVDSGQVAVGTIEMAEEERSLGWHPFEVWLDRTRGAESRWRVRFNGIDVLDYTGPLQGASENVVSAALHMQLESAVTDLSNSPFYQLVDDLEIWEAPPPGAFR